MKKYPLLLVVAALLIIGGSTAIFASMNDQRADSLPAGVNSTNESGKQEAVIENNEVIEKEKKDFQEDQKEVDNEPSEEKQVEEEFPDPIIPERISIPAIGVDAPITPTGLDENREMVVPDNGEDVAWFEPGRMPGALGNSVLAGHVDDYTGPAVFFYLKDLQPGDEIEVTGKDGEVLTFVVEKLEAYPMDEAPLREVFGPTDDRSLNLITCTGLYDRNLQTHQERLVVYTTLKSE